MAGALPEEYLAHPLTLMPELDVKGYVAEIISSTATLMQVVLMLQAAVSSRCGRDLFLIGRFADRPVAAKQFT